MLHFPLLVSLGVLAALAACRAGPATARPRVRDPDEAFERVRRQAAEGLELERAMDSHARETEQGIAPRGGLFRPDALEAAARGLCDAPAGASRDSLARDARDTSARKSRERPARDARDTSTRLFRDLPARGAGEERFSRMRRQGSEELELERAIERHAALETGVVEDAEGDDHEQLRGRDHARSRDERFRLPPPRRIRAEGSPEAGEQDLGIQPGLRPGPRPLSRAAEGEQDLGIQPGLRPGPRPPWLARTRPPASGSSAVGFIRRAAVLSIACATEPLRFTRHDIKTAGVFIAIPLALILSGSDESTTHMIDGSRSAGKDRLARAGDQLGEVPVAVGILAGFGACGYLLDDPRGVHTLESGLIALALAGGLTTALKYATGRARPELGLGSRSFEPFGGEMSFPSGHTAVAFSLAGVIGYHYPGWIGRTALLGACATGFARIYNFHHWTSDVVFAAMISSATAHYVSRMNLAAARGDLTFEPFFGPASRGLAIRRRF